MKIQILSDLHLEFETMVPEKPQVDFVILAGDIHMKHHGVSWAKKHFSCPVVYVAGNHEHYGNSLGRTPRKMKEAAEGSNVHVLHNESLILDGVRILGATLWTDYRLTGNQPLAQFDAMQIITDFKSIRTRSFQKIRPWDVLEEHMAARRFLEDTLATPFTGKTVVVTHHAPSIRSIHERYRGDKGHLSASYASDMERFLGDASAALWVHGHTHDSFDYDAYGTRVVCNPRGYAPKDLNPEFDSGLVIEI